MSKIVEIAEISPIKKSNYRVLTGISGAGFIGNTALMYIVRSKNYPLVAEVKSKLIPPTVLLMEGKPVHSFRIYLDDKDDLIFLVSEALIAPEKTWEVGLKLLEWLNQKGVTSFVSIEGMPFSTGEEKFVYGFVLPHRQLAQFGVTNIMEGGVSGINAVLLDGALEGKIPWTSLFVPTPFMSSIDYGGTAAVVEVLNKMYKFGVDVKPLKQTSEMRRQMANRPAQEKRRGLMDSLRRRK